MNENTLEKISTELAYCLKGQRFGKIFNLSRFRLAVDFRLSDSSYLFISIEPSAPRVYLIKRRLRDLEKQTANPTPFVLFLRKRLANSVLQTIEKIENERILRFGFTARNELGERENYTLVVQLTGRSANLFLLDENDFILDRARETFGDGQEIAQVYSLPKREYDTRKKRSEETFPQGEFETLSESLDAHFLEKESEKVFAQKAQAAQSKLKQEIAKREKLIAKLNSDLENHGDAEKWKRSGDLLLANLATLKRSGGKVFVTDYYDENAPTIEIEIEENYSITEAAEKFFKRYTKARNAAGEISKRLLVTESQLDELRARKMRLDKAVEEKDSQVLEEFFAPEKTANSSVKIKEKKTENFNGARRYVSSDGFEILVGRAAKDNDFLTFRVAKSSDLWLHAADYPGSHVVVKNPNRLAEIPQKTLLEAAQLAAFFSSAKSQAKVAVHYTQKKHVGKPKGAAFGLVSLSSFKTILVEPKGLESEK